jgi:hypothetical protein
VSFVDTLLDGDIDLETVLNRLPALIPIGQIIPEQVLDGERMGLLVEKIWKLHGDIVLKIVMIRKEVMIWCLM